MSNTTDRPTRFSITRLEDRIVPTAMAWSFGDGSSRGSSSRKGGSSKKCKNGSSKKDKNGSSKRGKSKKHGSSKKHRSGKGMKCKR